MKDNGYVIWKIFNKYGDHDPRIWTVLLNPGEESVYITCYLNTESKGDIPVFEIQDSSSIYRNYAKIQTRSIEVIINTLLNRGVEPNSTTYRQQEPVQ